MHFVVERVDTEFLEPGFLGPPGPLPQAVRHAGRKAMAELARREYDLPPVVALMGDEIGEDVPHIERQVTPRIGRRWRNLAVILKPPGPAG